MPVRTRWASFLLRGLIKNTIIIYFYDAKYQKKCYTSEKKIFPAKKNEKLPR